MGELDALGNVTLEAVNSLGEESLLLLSYASERVGGLFGTVGLQELVSVIKHTVARTYAKLNGNGEEIGASLLGNGITAGNTGEVDVAGLDEALFALNSTDDLFSEARNV